MITDLLRPSRYTDAATQKRRMEICAACPRRSNIGQCRECGCFLNLKTRLTTEKCPLDKW